MWLYLLKNHLEVLYFSLYVMKLRVNCMSVHTLQTIGLSFIHFMFDSGIIYQISCPHTPA